MTLGFTETFPPFDLSKFAKKTSKVCVVAIIGKGRYSAFTSKATLLNPTIGKNVFKGLEDVSTEDEMEYYYDACRQVVYVHYSSLLDTQRLANLCLKMDSDVAQQDFHTIWELEEFHHAKTWLLLFCISHVIVLVHPGSSFDPSYIRIFRILDTVRIQLQGLMSEQLQGFPISKDWCVNGRPCSPRVLFVFETTLLDVTTDENDLKVRPQRNPPLKRLQHATEDQIYRLLRKSRVITNISNNSLFAVPANQEFVYIHNRKADINDPVLYFLLQLRNSHTVNKDGEPTKGGKSYQTNRRTNQGSPGRNDGTMRSTLANKSLSTSSDNSFHDFLWPHIQLAFTKGFDDNVGKRQIPALFEMTTGYTWFSLAAKLYQFFFHDLDKKSSVFNKMRFKLDVDIRFSENRCNKVLPVAENAYQDGLPTHYTFSYHVSKFNQAKRVFAQYARGPAYDKYLRQLEESCEKWWKNGRQLCEEVSLTGQHCVNPLHQLPDSLETEENQHLPVMPHSSQVKTKAACNCGRKQAEKDDPFSHEAANFEFYENLEKICCSSLQHVEIPVFKPDTDSFVASPLVFFAPHFSSFFFLFFFFLVRLSAFFFPPSSLPPSLSLSSLPPSLSLFFASLSLSLLCLPLSLFFASLSLSSFLPLSLFFCLPLSLSSLPPSLSLFFASLFFASLFFLNSLSLFFSLSLSLLCLPLSLSSLPPSLSLLCSSPLSLFFASLSLLLPPSLSLLLSFPPLSLFFIILPSLFFAPPLSSLSLSLTLTFSLSFF
ncbi:SMG8 [Acanthosepion pharaonis]|uniref:Nonsense-mediated mRNA decay factor SMG8 n=1 Tax=Acanthosepion pharaonis TaxID=158019 RepID=A0A812CVZ0_ACAPH|nr:SMG8 [Sepia pharaonis]